MNNIKICSLAGYLAIASCSRSNLTSPLVPQAEVGERQNVRLQRLASSPALQQTEVGYKILHDFAGYPKDAGEPGALINVGGQLYGAAEGGTEDLGTIVRLSLTGSDSVLYNFTFEGKGGAIGPIGPLVYQNGVFYGTAEGGASEVGSVFSVGLDTRTEHLIYSFKNSKTDGQIPVSLIDVNGILYGTTTFGGPGGYGTIFRLSTAGRESLVSSFAVSDGTYPVSLVDVGNTLYGVNVLGGISSVKARGTVFKTDLSGPASALYKFKGEPDGSSPAGGLTYYNGAFYGVTQEGGGSACTWGCGTVFRLSPSGAESVIYRFKGGADGSSPVSKLVELSGNLYGTTVSGGGTADICPAGCGTIFKITPTGVETVLHRFKGGTDGYSASQLIEVGGVLYGTAAGGKYEDGIFFEIGP